MFIRVFTIFFSLVALAGFAAAVPAEKIAIRQSGCNSGNVQCCHTVQSSDNPQWQNIYNSLGIVQASSTTQIGMACNPVNVFGVGAGGQCGSSVVCCQGSSFLGGAVFNGCNAVTTNIIG